MRRKQDYSATLQSFGYDVLTKRHILWVESKHDGRRLFLELTREQLTDLIEDAKHELDRR